jgi:PKD repeat protein
MGNCNTKIAFVLFGLLSLIQFNVKAQDAGVSLLLSPIDQTCGSSTAAVTAIVSNYGTSSITNIPVQANITGSSSITLKDTLKKTIASGKQDTITFKTTINIYSGGTFNFKIFTNISGDTKHSNDTISVKLSIYAFPSTPTGNSPSICGTGILNFIVKSTPNTTYWYTTASGTYPPWKRGDSIPVNAPAIGSYTYYASSVVAPVDKVTTNFTGINNQNGNVFNVKIYKDVIIDSFDVSPLTSGSDSVYFYYIQGGYTSTNKLSSSGWTFAGRSPIYSSTSGSGSKARAVFPPVLLKAGKTYGFYIFTYGAFTSSATSKLNYTTSTGPDSSYTSVIKVYNGDGVQGLFGTGASGNFFNPRFWNGTIYYSTPLCESNRITVTGVVNKPVRGLSLSQNKTSKGAFNKGTSGNPDEICVGDSLKYDLSTPSNFLNSDYGTKWTISYSMKTSKGTVTTNYATVNPSSTTKGIFSFIPKTADADSTYILTVKTSAGCDSFFTRYIHVNQVPAPIFTIGNICQGHTTALTNSSTPSGKIKFLWNFGNGDTSSAQLPTYTYGSTGTYSLSLMVFNGGCSSTLTKSVTIYNAPYGSNFVKGTPFRGQMNNGDQYDADNVCIGDTNTYNITAPKGVSNSDYGTKWVIKNISFVTPYGNKTKDTLTKLPTATKSFQFMFFPTTNVDSVFILKLTISTLPGNCDTLMYRYIHVRIKPVAGFSFTNACFGSPVLFKDTSSIKISSLTNWAWNFGDATTSTSQNPAHNYAKAGPYKVTLTAYSDAGCANTATATVNEYPRTLVKFGAIAGCNGTASTFTDSSTLASGTISGWKWYFGDGATSAFENTTHDYIKSGPYSVKLVTSTGFGCKDSLTKKIRVLPTPVAIFGEKLVCVGAQMFFANTSTDSVSGSSYLWDFGDGKTSTQLNGSHIYTANGTYKVILKISSKNGCSDTVSHLVTPYAKPDVNVFIKTGCINTATYFADSSKSGSKSLYTWVFGDGKSEISHNAATSHIYTKSGTYNLSLSILNEGNCADSQLKTVTISDNPKAGFTTADVCIGKPTKFTNTSTTGNLTYIWDFGDGSKTDTTKDASNLYAAAGSYTVKLAATNNAGCADTFRSAVNVNALPVPPAWVRNQKGYVVTFTPKDTTLASYEWYFGTATNDSSSKKVPTFTYPTADKRYAVKLVVKNKAGCTAFRTDSIGMGKYGIEEILNTLGDVKVFPNPFEGKTNIRYTLQHRSKVSIRIYDLQGREVAMLRDGMYNAGEYTDVFDASKYQAANGVYFLKIFVDDKYYSVKIVNQQ